MQKIIIVSHDTKNGLTVDVKDELQSPVSQIELDTAIERAEDAEEALRESEEDIKRLEKQIATMTSASDAEDMAKRIDELQSEVDGITHRYDTFGLGDVTVTANNLSVASAIEAFAESQGWRLI